MNKADEPARRVRYDAFISYGRDELETVVRPLYEHLTGMGLRIWFDKEEVKIGDRIHSSINRGLGHSDYGIVVLSEGFLKRRYTIWELEAFLIRQLEGDESQKVLLPLYFGIDEKTVAEYSYPLANLHADTITENNIEEVAEQLYEVIVEDRGEPVSSQIAEEDTEETPGSPDEPHAEPPPTGYLSPLGSSNEDRHVLIESPVDVYRRGGDRYEVVAETDGQVIDLGIRDASVSRKKLGRAPVAFEPGEDGGVALHNDGSTNPLTVEYGVGVPPVTVPAGEEIVLADTCTVRIGFNTRLKLEFGHDTFGIEELVDSEDGVTRDGAVVEGVSPAVFVREAVDNLLYRARHGSPDDCLKSVRNLHAFLDEHPVSVGDYDDVRDELERLVTRLDAELSGPDPPDRPAPEWVEQFELVSEDIERMYGREYPGPSE
jgi:hypothetical protein